MGNIKAYYKACTTTKAYIIYTKKDTTYTFKATNNIDGLIENANTILLASAYYYCNLGNLEVLFNKMMGIWLKNCYYYTFAAFLEKYDLSENQFLIIKRLIKKGGNDE